MFVISCFLSASLVASHLDSSFVPVVSFISFIVNDFLLVYVFTPPIFFFFLPLYFCSLLIDSVLSPFSFASALFNRCTSNEIPPEMDNCCFENINRME